MTIQKQAATVADDADHFARMSRNFADFARRLAIGTTGTQTEHATGEIRDRIEHAVAALDAANEAMTRVRDEYVAALRDAFRVVAPIEANL